MKPDRLTPTIWLRIAFLNLLAASLHVGLARDPLSCPLAGDCISFQMRQVDVVSPEE